MGFGNSSKFISLCVCSEFESWTGFSWILVAIWKRPASSLIWILIKGYNFLALPSTSNHVPFRIFMFSTWLFLLLWKKFRSTLRFFARKKKKHVECFLVHYKMLWKNWNRFKMFRDKVFVKCFYTLEKALKRIYRKDHQCSLSLYT